tara:strand:- start:98 stop:205 length:108 start_codon:yes stop_codon:yes gene_type:complete
MRERDIFGVDEQLILEFRVLQLLQQSIQKRDQKGI